MNKMRDFKNIADDIMKDIKVDEDLKKKTLEKSLKKNNMPISKVLIPAACFLLIIGIVNIAHILPLKNPKIQTEYSDTNIISSVGETESAPEDSNINILNAEEKSWAIDTFDDAKRNFGNAFLVPTYIPEDYDIEEITASGLEEGNASKIIINYFLESKSFFIIQEKIQIENELVNYEKVDINGTIGLLKENILISNKYENTINTELYWSRDGIHYSITGLITQEDAIKIARSMK